MPSTKTCTFEGSEQLQNTAGLCAKHWHRAKGSPDGKSYAILNSCLICRDQYDHNNKFCAKCLKAYSDAERRKIYKRAHYNANYNRYKESRLANKASPAKAKSYNIKYHYGLTEAEYSDMLQAHDNKCAICNRRPTDAGWSGWLVTDHNHATGRARGILCHSCNVGLGHFRDDPDLLRRAAAYLERPEGWWK